MVVVARLIPSLGCSVRWFFFFNDTATTEIYTLSLHDALPICQHFALGAGARIERPQALHAIARPRAEEQHLAPVARDRDGRGLSRAEATRGGVAIEELGRVGRGGERGAGDRSGGREAAHERQGAKVGGSHSAAV